MGSRGGTRGSYGEVAALLAVLAFAGCGGGERGPATPEQPSAPATIAITSPAFADGGEIPRELTCDGAGEPPPLAWTGVPAGARELVLTVEDPDAPGGTYVHWTLFGLAPDARGVGPGALPAGAREGESSDSDSGWTAPCPPEGDQPHRYVFTLYALDRPSGLEAGAEAAEVRDVLGVGALARGAITGRYGRQG